MVEIPLRDRVCEKYFHLVTSMETLEGGFRFPERVLRFITKAE